MSHTPHTPAANIITGCAAYIALLEAPANAWGRHLGPEGDSATVLVRLCSQFGSQAVEAELKRQFAQAREQARDARLALA